jgi:uncharacterized protein YndB with AHSA1/START domain
MQRVEIDRDFDLPVGRVFAYLSEHENLGPLFGARVSRVRDGDEARNGVGSVRRLRVGPLPGFEETVTGYVPDERIEYRITRGGPLRDHHGTMSFRPSGAGTHLHCVIEFGAALPGVDRAAAAALYRSIPRGLDQAAKNA